MTHDNADHAADPPSDWVLRFAPAIPAGGEVLDLACGAGRHTRLFLRLGHSVLAVDRDTSWLDDIAGADGLTILQTDLESERGAPAEIADAKFAGVVVTNYLHRPLMPWIAGAVDVGGVLIYETFAVGNEKFGHPRNPDFLLRPAELQDAFADILDVLGYEHGQFERGGSPAVIQRIATKKVQIAPGSGA